MLAFYGVDLNEGSLRPAANSSSRRMCTPTYCTRRRSADEPVRNLYHCPHNLLRITRILKHLSEIKPLQPHAAPLVLYFTAQHSEGAIDLSEGSFHGGSLDRWWSNVFRDAQERKEVRGIVKSRGQFGAGDWGMGEFQDWYEKRGKKGWTQS